MLHEIKCALQWQEINQLLLRNFEEIQRRVSEHYNIRLSEMIGPKRVRTYARPRQMAMYLAKHMTNRSLPEIGRRFGGRDHTTVMHFSIHVC